MKITNIAIKNLIGISSADIEVGDITIIAGENGAGKSSIAAAVRMAITGELERVNLKKQAGELAFNGAKDFGAMVTIDEHQYTCGKAFGKAKHLHEDDFSKFDIVTSAIGLAERPAKEIVEHLLSASDLSLSHETVRKELTKSFDASMVDKVIPLLRISFEAAENECKAQSREAKALWKNITKETYGPEKAETWKAEKPEVDNARIDEIKKEREFISTQVTQLLSDIAKEEERIKHEERRNKQVAELEIKSGKIDSLKELHEQAVTELAEYEKIIADLTEKADGTPEPDSYKCPCCDNLLMFYKGELKPWEHEGKAPDREARQSLERLESSKTILVNQVARRKKELDEAVQAKAVLDSMKIEEQQAPFCVISVAQNLIAEKTNAEKALLNELRALENAELEASAADKKTTEAKTHHEKSLLWSKLAEELSPSGIQLRITGKAVEAFNRKLRSYDGMPLVQIDVNGAITLNNRSYYLLSLSEKWRVNTLLALAYAEITDVKLVILDCLDVLDMPSRMPFMKLFKTLIDQERMDSIIAIATLKQLPKLPEAFTCYWVENGTVLENNKETEAA